jgi:hypothetical protein
LALGYGIFVLIGIREALQDIFLALQKRSVCRCCSVCRC